MKKPKTPFPTTGYYGTDYFCDREKEIEQMKRNALGGSSTTLVALRRMGKTALIRHLHQHLKEEFQGIYLDILPTESMNDFLNYFATAVANAVPERSKTGTRIWKFLRSLRPVVGYDSLTGTPTVSFQMDGEESRRSVSEIFLLLESQPRPVLLAIDEFQQILHYPEKQVDAWLRTRIQEMKNVQFIFSGSQQHLMNDLFANPDRPFFRSTQFLRLGRIDRPVYHAFIREKFEKHRKQISDDSVDEILDWSDGYTYYVQLLCNRIFLASGRQVTRNLWKEEADKLLKEQEFVFYSYREMLTVPQWNLLKAIAREGVITSPTSSGFITTYHLGNPATVLRSLHALMKKELIYREPGEDGKSQYSLYDVLFRRWMER